MSFCGNPRNHEAHDFQRPAPEDSPEIWTPTLFHCEGVGRVEVKDEIVEKYEPATMAEDGTAYSKVTIIVEDLKTGEARVIISERASRVMLETEYEKYVHWQSATRDIHPQINRVEFSFMPNPLDETGVAFTIEEVKNDGTAAER